MAKYDAKFNYQVVQAYLPGKSGTSFLAKNRIHRRFHTSIPHQKFTTDMAEFKYYEK
ncbi:hypothetical protein [Vagococcus penaei]|uniref:hypothetical protein n=1 Tax=Vagococcus penaei TaxID=633807 RepID=UPI0013734612|nr:hypothetical protein [Vagococcus penaei]